MIHLNMLADPGRSAGIITATTTSGERFEPRRVKVSDWRALVDCARKTFEADPWLAEVIASVPGSRRALAWYRRDERRAC